MKKIRMSLIINTLIIIFVFFGIVTMFNGIKFMKDETLLELTGFEMFRFYTVDSNVLIGIASLLFFIYECKYYKKEIKKIPDIIYIFKFVGTSCITLTFITTLLFLAPKYGFYAMFNNSNLFFHLIIPVLSLVTFIFCEKYDYEYKYALFGIIPMMVYSFYYTARILAHLKSGGLTYKYDFYGFLYGNLNNVFIVIPVIYIATYLISFALIYLNKKLIIKES